MSSFEIKVPYGVIARPESETERRLVDIVDSMARGLRILDITNPLEDDVRNELLAKHVENAYEYYKTFSTEEMAAMVLIDSMLEKATKKEVDPDDK